MFIVMVVFSIPGLSSAEDGALKPSRQECIQEVIFDWVGYTESEVDQVQVSIQKALVKYWANNYSDDLVIPVSVFRSHLAGKWYLQYPKECSNKKSMTIYLVEKVLKPSVERLPPYNISDAVVIPSSKTISAKGVYWRKDEFD